MLYHDYNRVRGFTLIELIVTITMLAVITAIVVVVINPVGLLQRSRDATRIHDLRSLNTALEYFQANGGGSLGLANTIYVSVVDTGSSACASLSLPSLPPGWSYRCVTSSANLQKVDGNGWIPADFTSVFGGSPLPQLPIDPVNSVEDGRYYTYTANGSWQMTAVLESSLYTMGGDSDKASTDGGSYPSLLEVGNTITLHPVEREDSLVGYWKFDEGSGGVVYDASGNGNDAALHGGAGWASGKSGSALDVDGSGDFASSSNAAELQIQGAITISAWVYPTANGQQNGSRIVSKDSENNRYEMVYRNNGGSELNTGRFHLPGNYSLISGGNALTQNAWNHMVVRFDGDTAKIYVNNQVIANDSNPPSAINNSAGDLMFGAPQTSQADRSFQGRIDNVRIYNRALSPSEISALYEKGF